jgi:D-alanyl-D-alanine carboxypeptidase (penicillin-binding protein 5/6)
MRNQRRFVRGFISVLAAVVVLGSVAPVSAAPRRRSSVLTAKAAILVDRQSGVVLWEHNADFPLPPASTTKVATASLALQSGKLSLPMTVSRRAAQEPPSKISLRQGWTVRLRDLVYAVLLSSANDASVVIAEGLSGSVEAFAARMNAHAMAVGATQTNFVNPNGLPADNHYSTARDLAKIFDHALDHPEFRRIVETRNITIAPASGSRRRITLHSKNRLLSGYHIKVVGKTGWTRAARKCFVGAGTVGNREVLIAVLGSDDLWGDVRRLMEFGFDEAAAPSPRRAIARATQAAPSLVGAGDSDEASRYYVRLATFRSVTSANQLTRAVKRDGFPARVYRIRLKGRHYYRVSVGSYSSRNRAAMAAKQIERMHPNLDPPLVSS